MTKIAIQCPTFYLARQDSFKFIWNKVKPLLKWLAKIVDNKELEKWQL